MQAGVLAVLTAGTAVHAQPASVPLQPSIQDSGNAFVRFFRDGEWYFSWGYNKEYWAPTDIHVSQASLGNNFTIHGVQGADEFSFPEIFSPSLFGPQYNIASAASSMTSARSASNSVWITPSTRPS